MVTIWNNKYKLVVIELEMELFQKTEQHWESWEQYAFILYLSLLLFLFCFIFTFLLIIFQNSCSLSKFAIIDIIIWIRIGD